MVRLVKADLDGLAEAAATVARGGVISYPTDTVYGLGCDPKNEAAVGRLVNAKGGRTKPMPVLVKTVQEAEGYGYVSENARKLAAKFWPGQLTIVLAAKESLPQLLVPSGTVGVRSPDHALCQELLGLCSGALVGTSANLSNKPPAISAEQVVNELGDQMDLVLDGGRARIGVASTVVDLTKPRPTVLREGPIGAEEIMKCLRGLKAR
jgi:L-threonylcarbamoyladenylate synthase